MAEPVNSVSSPHFEREMKSSAAMPSDLPYTEQLSFQAIHLKACFCRLINHNRPIKPNENIPPCFRHLDPKSFGVVLPSLHPDVDDLCLHILNCLDHCDAPYFYGGFALYIALFNYSKKEIRFGDADIGFDVHSEQFEPERYLRIVADALFLEFQKKGFLNSSFIFKVILKMFQDRCPSGSIITSLIAFLHAHIHRQYRINFDFFIEQAITECGGRTEGIDLVILEKAISLFERYIKGTISETIFYFIESKIWETFKDSVSSFLYEFIKINYLQKTYLDQDSNSESIAFFICLPNRFDLKFVHYKNKKKGSQNICALYSVRISVYGNKIWCVNDHGNCTTKEQFDSQLQAIQTLTFDPENFGEVEFNASKLIHKIGQGARTPSLFSKNISEVISRLSKDYPLGSDLLKYRYFNHTRSHLTNDRFACAVDFLIWIFLLNFIENNAHRISYQRDFAVAYLENPEFSLLKIVATSVKNQGRDFDNQFTSHLLALFDGVLFCESLKPCSKVLCHSYNDPNGPEWRFSIEDDAGQVYYLPMKAQSHVSLATNFVNSLSILGEEFIQYLSGIITPGKAQEYVLTLINVIEKPFLTSTPLCHVDPTKMFYNALQKLFQKDHKAIAEELSRQALQKHNDPKVAIQWLYVLVISPHFFELEERLVESFHSLLTFTLSKSATHLLKPLGTIAKLILENGKRKDYPHSLILQLCKQLMTNGQKEIGLKLLTNLGNGNAHMLSEAQECVLQETAVTTTPTFLDHCIESLVLLNSGQKRDLKTISRTDLETARKTVIEQFSLSQFDRMMSDSQEIDQLFKNWQLHYYPHMLEDKIKTRRVATCTLLMRPIGESLLTRAYKVTELILKIIEIRLDTEKINVLVKYLLQLLHENSKEISALPKIDSEILSDHLTKTIDQLLKNENTGDFALSLYQQAQISKALIPVHVGSIRANFIKTYESQLHHLPSDLLNEHVDELFYNFDHSEQTRKTTLLYIFNLIRACFKPKQTFDTLASSIFDKLIGCFAKYWDSEIEEQCIQLIILFVRKWEDREKRAQQFINTVSNKGVLSRISKKGLQDLCKLMSQSGHAIVRGFIAKIFQQQEHFDSIICEHLFSALALSSDQRFLETVQKIINDPKFPKENLPIHLNLLEYLRNLGTAGIVLNNDYLIHGETFLKLLESCSPAERNTHKQTYAFVLCKIGTVENVLKASKILLEFDPLPEPLTFTFLLELIKQGPSIFTPEVMQLLEQILQLIISRPLLNNAPLLNTVLDTLERLHQHYETDHSAGILKCAYGIFELFLDLQKIMAREKKEGLETPLKMHQKLDKTSQAKMQKLFTCMAQSLPKLGSYHQFVKLEFYAHDYLDEESQKKYREDNLLPVLKGHVKHLRCDYQKLSIAQTFQLFRQTNSLMELYAKYARGSGRKAIEALSESISINPIWAISIHSIIRQAQDLKVFQVKIRANQSLKAIRKINDFTRIAKIEVKILQSVCSLIEHTLETKDTSLIKLVNFNDTQECVVTLKSISLVNDKILARAIQSKDASEYHTFIKTIWGLFHNPIILTGEQNDFIIKFTRSLISRMILYPVVIHCAKRYYAQLGHTTAWIPLLSEQLCDPKKRPQFVQMIDKQLLETLVSWKIHAKDIASLTCLEAITEIKGGIGAALDFILDFKEEEIDSLCLADVITIILEVLAFLSKTPLFNHFPYSASYKEITFRSIKTLFEITQRVASVVFDSDDSACQQFQVALQKIFTEWLARRKAEG